VPFLRPAEISRDSSKDIEFMEHAINWFKKKEGKIPEYLVQIRPTTPLREPELIDAAIVKMIDNSQATSLRSVHEIRESPYKLLELKMIFW